MAAARVSFSPMTSSNVSLLRIIEVAKIGFTVTLQIADTSPHLAVIVAVPTEMAVTTPSSETAATSSLELLHTIVLSVVFSGSTVAVKVLFSPMTSSIDSLSRTTDVAITGFTVTLQVAETSPHLAVIVAVPTEMAVTTPSSETAATSSLELLHTIVLSVVFSGSTVAVKVLFSPMTSSIDSLSRTTDVAITGFTVTLQVAETSPHLAVIVAVPTEMAVTTPSSETVATFSASVIQIINLLTAS